MKKTDFDVIIIGGGPGGLAAGLWCVDLGLTAIVIEREAEAGGQLLRTYNRIENYLGVEAVNGRELRDIFLRHIEKKRVHLRCGVAVESANLAEKTVVLADGQSYRGRAIIIGTGVRRRQLGVPGEVEFHGRGILESGEKCKSEVAGKRVAIVGGGDAALENALILAQTAYKVFIIHRRTEFRARQDFVRRCLESQKIEIRYDSIVTAIVGSNAVKAVTLKDVVTENISNLAIDAVLIRIGEEPNTDLFRGQIQTDNAGFIMIDKNGATNLSNVFAIGDVSNPIAPTINSAVGTGAAAAKSIAANLATRDA